MLDYRKQSVGAVNDVISSFRKSEQLREGVLNGLLAVVVWHSIKDGQATPGINLFKATRGQREQICLYLTKFGNFKFSKKEGLMYDKSKTAKQYGLQKANEVFDALPTLEQAFPSQPRNYKDMPFMDSIKHLLKRADEVKNAGKSVLFANDEEKQLFDAMEKLAKVAV